MGFFHGVSFLVCEIKWVGCIFAHVRLPNEQIHDPPHRYGKVDRRPDHADGEHDSQVFQTAFPILPESALTLQAITAKDVHTGHGAVLGTADIGDGIQ